MGVVLRGHDPKLEREVAVKVVPPHLRAEPTVAERFKREAMAIARISHPNVVRVFDVGEEGNFLYYVMELLPGQGLNRRTMKPEHARKVGPPLEFDSIEFFRIFTPLADALSVIHDNGLVHRDIKPANIMSGVPERGAVLTDFGLVFASDDVSLTQTGVVVGTGRYMAPEQIQGITADALADIYSLGMSMYEYATRQLPFQDFKGRQLLAVKLRKPIDPVGSIVACIPDPVGALIDRCCHLDREKRFPDARSLCKAMMAAARALDPSLGDLSSIGISLPSLDSLSVPLEIIQSPKADPVRGQGDRTAAESGELQPAKPSAQVTSSATRRAPGDRAAELVAARGIVFNLLLVVIILIVGSAVVAMGLQRWPSAKPDVRPPALTPAISEDDALVPQELGGRASPRLRSKQPGSGIDALTPLLLDGPACPTGRVGLAAIGKTVLAVWLDVTGKVIARISGDGGGLWSVPELDGTARAHPLSRIWLRASGERFHLLFAAKGEAGTARVATRWCDPAATTWRPTVDLGEATQPGWPMSLSADPGEPGRLLASWRNLSKSRQLSLSWSEDGGESWSLPEVPDGATDRVREISTCFTAMGTLVAWERTDDNDEDDIVFSMDRRQGEGWSPAARVFLTPPISSAAAVSGQEGLTRAVSRLIKTLGEERGMPVLAASADGTDRVFLQWCEQFLAGGQRLMITSSDSNLDRFGAVQALGQWPTNSRRSDVLVRGDRVWSVWEDKRDDVLYGSLSRDGGASWTRRRTLDKFRSVRVHPRLASPSANEALVIWSGADNQVRIARLH